MRLKMLFLISIIGLCIVPMAIVLPSASEDQETAAAYQIENDPLTIAVSNVGQTASFWYLSVNSVGNAALMVDAVPERRHRKFTVPKEQLVAFRKLLLSERFFELQAAYGQIVPDSGTTTITVIAGDELKTVRIHFLGNWAKDDKRRLREPARALRVLRLIYSWCDDPITTETRRSLQKVIKLAESPAK